MGECHGHGVEARASGDAAERTHRTDFRLLMATLNGGNEIAGACAALEKAGCSVTGMQGISKSSQGLVATLR